MLDPFEVAEATPEADVARSRWGGRQPLVSFVWLCKPWTEDAAAQADYYLRLIDELDRPAELVVIGNGLESHFAAELTSRLRSETTPVAFVNFGYTCGEAKAFRIGFERATGQYLVVIPSSTQSAPSDIRRVIEAVEGDLDYAATFRSPRRGGWFRRMRSKIYNGCVQLVSGIRLTDINSGLCGMRREVVDALPLYGDLHLFLPVLAARQGYRIGELPVPHRKERFGKGPRNIVGYVRRVLDLFTLFFLTRFTEKPFRLFGGLGAGLASVGCLAAAAMLVQRLLGQPLGDRPGLILAIFAVVVGIQLLSLGLLGELMIYVDATKSRRKHIKQITEHPLPPMEADDCCGEESYAEPLQRA